MGEVVNEGHRNMPRLHALKQFCTCLDSCTCQDYMIYALTLCMLTKPQKTWSFVSYSHRGRKCKDKRFCSALKQNCITGKSKIYETIFGHLNQDLGCFPHLSYHIGERKSQCESNFLWQGQQFWLSRSGLESLFVPSSRFLLKSIGFSPKWWYVCIGSFLRFEKVWATYV